MTTLFNQPLNVINVGIAMFSDDLKKQHVPVTQLDWTPPGQGNMQVVEALDQLAENRWRRKLPPPTKSPLSALFSPIRCWWAMTRRLTWCRA
jgi:hypothetical protein